MLVLRDLGSNLPSTLEANIALRMPSEDTQWAISLEMFMQMPGMVTNLVFDVCFVFTISFVAL